MDFNLKRFLCKFVPTFVRGDSSEKLHNTIGVFMVQNSLQGSNSFLLKLVVILNYLVEKLDTDYHGGS